MNKRFQWTTQVVVEIAKLHYEEGWKVKDIATRYDLSEATIHRRLSEAKVQGIFRLHVTTDLEQSEYDQLGTNLKKKYPFLKQVRITIGNHSCLDAPKQTAGYYRQTVLEEIARGAAEVIRTYIKPASVVAISSGELIKMAVSHIRTPTPLEDLDIVPLTGYLSPDPDLMQTSANFNADLLQKRVGGRFHPLPVVGIVLPEDKSTVEGLPIVKTTLPILKSTDVAVISVRPVDQSFISGLAFTRSYLGDQTLNEYRRSIVGKGKKPVGVIGSEGFDGKGLPTRPLLSSIGLELQDLKVLVSHKKGTVILVAGVQDRERILAINAALKGRFCNVLVSDHITIKALLELA